MLRLIAYAVGSWLIWTALLMIFVALANPVMGRYGLLVVSVFGGGLWGWHTGNGLRRLSGGAK